MTTAPSLTNANRNRSRIRRDTPHHAIMPGRAGQMTSDTDITPGSVRVHAPLRHSLCPAHRASTVVSVARRHEPGMKIA